MTESNLVILELVCAVLGLGLLDSLNPFSIAAMALVLTCTRPLVVGIVFIATTFVVYTLGGIGLIAGWATFLSQFLPLIPSWAVDVGLVVLGFSCLAAGWFMWTKGDDKSSPLANLVRTSIIGTALYAASSTISDLPTAVPYFAAVHILAEANLSLAECGALILLYNICYVTPLAILLAIRLSGKMGVEKAFDAIRNRVDWCFARLVPPLTGCLGLYCLWVVGSRLL